MLGLPLAATAQPVTGIYVNVEGGLNMLQDQTLKSLTIGGVPVAGVSGSKVQSDLGEAALAAVGWGFGNGLRAEVEFAYRYNSLSNVKGPAGVSGAIGGSEQKYGPMVNVVYDFAGFVPAVVPYVGVGAGYQFSDDEVTVGGTTVSDTRGSFAYQAILGAGLPIQSAPGLTLLAEYRFMGLAGDRKFSDAGGTATVRDNFNHSFLIGVRYNFGQAPAPAPMAAPAPAPAPAVQPARSYLVFFDWDKATLTDRARQIVKEAADNSSHVQYTRIEVNGYTDTSGTPQYNQRLSVRRAQAVAAELVRDGVPRNAISIQGFGETHLLVPTGPNVREPQNRRVEIIIR
jgi:outer membrane protein OmpA-like peptidoglycan-associated protein